jgi:hypothetical protein
MPNGLPTLSAIHSELICWVWNFILQLTIYDSDKGRAVASILIAALDGMAIQQSLDVLPEERDEMVETFVDFFLKSIPAYLNSNK